MTTMANQNKEWERKYWHKRLLAASGNDSAWQKLYTQYLDTDIWKEIRHKAIARAGYRCERCNALYAGEIKLQVHHKTYDRVGGFEKDSDLEVVCAGQCHREADEEREERVEEERGYAIYQMRLDGWGRARYKDEWEIKKYDNELEVEEEFHRFAYKDWCEKNGEPYNKRRVVPDEFIELLMENRDSEYEEYHGDIDSWYQ